MTDKLGARIKENYENRTKYLLPRRSYHIIRLDGKAFHTYTRGCKRPYDLELMEDMNETAKFLCENIQGAKGAFVQSDEISILITDFDSEKTECYFDGKIQKIVSVTASMAGAKFNQLRMKRLGRVLTDEESLAFFDSRVFTVPDVAEVENVFIWRQIDATKNSIQMLAQTHFSHSQCQNKNGSQLQDMLMIEKGINWNDCPAGFKRGRFVKKETYTVPASEIYNKKGQKIKVPEHVRTRWVVVEPPIFTKDRSFLKEIIPSPTQRPE